MKPTKTWILIADASRARVLEQVGKGNALSEVAGLRFEHDVPATHELVDDSQGRTMTSARGGKRHAFAPKSDPNREAKRHFMQDLAAILEERLAAGAFDRLMLVAPPQALGDLRAAISAKVADKVFADVHKDLTKVPDHRIAEHLEAL
jgi:protein required for attachment to host cells